MEEGKGKGRRMQGRESTYACECNREARLASEWGGAGICVRECVSCCLLLAWPCCACVCFPE